MQLKNSSDRASVESIAHRLHPCPKHFSGKNGFPELQEVVDTYNRQPVRIVNDSTDWF